MVALTAAAGFAAAVGGLAGFLLGKKASMWCPNCGGPSHHPGSVR
jgi:hypothetical protein